MINVSLILAIKLFNINILQCALICIHLHLSMPSTYRQPKAFNVRLVFQDKIIAKFITFKWAPAKIRRKPWKFGFNNHGSRININKLVTPRHPC